MTRNPMPEAPINATVGLPFAPPDSTDAVTQYKRDLRAKVEALPDEWDHPLEDYVVIEIVLALLDEEYMPRSRSDAPAGRATKSLFDEEATP
jgi:hypothetical protein